jgi:arylsulfatase
VVHWPSGIDKSRYGKFEHQPGHVIDIMATCIDVAGAGRPARFAGHEILPVEGVSLKPAFQGRSLNRKDAIYFEHHLNCAVRDGKWKLVCKGDTRSASLHPWELYDMETDRTETHNLAAEYPEKVAELSAKWEKWAWRAKVKPWHWKAK